MKYAALIGMGFIGLICGICAAAPAPPPEKLSLADLVNHPDRWPATVTLQRDFRMKNGAVAHKGDKARVEQFDGTRVGVAAGNLLFNIRPEDCGLLEAANQAWAALTPAQRAVDQHSLVADPSLWPERVAVTGGINCEFGKLPPGTEVGLLSVSNEGTDIAWPNSANRVAVEFDGTDVIARARQVALVDRDKRASRIATALKGIMVDADGKPYHDDHLGDKKIFALYYGASWCAPCHAFSPGFVKFLNETMPRHPELAVVLMGNDEKTDQMLAYMKEEKMPFPAVPLKELNRSPLLLSYAAQSIPHLVIVDRFGKVLATNDDNRGNRVDPKDTMAALNKLLVASANQR